ncbi:hypothetical protein SEMRO_837_G209130.1 [Seminavis robusta]|uniref:Uncharacterized protein n=1 Tax=Seminavis robusta TaxID=568900 RepID=A0A9N8EB80_9STRA|nr:hypothetical protein SEMRO_837_G209130.1 [Seminavis robusta]|eukprot:Sro837_g209130.1 n/a (272) ;mRNA; f:18630-19445
MSDSSYLTAEEDEIIVEPEQRLPRLSTLVCPEDEIVVMPPIEQSLPLQPEPKLPIVITTPASTYQSDSMKTEVRQNNSSDNELLDKQDHREHPSPTMSTQHPKQAETAASQIEGEKNQKTLLAEAKRALAYPKGRPKESAATKDGTQVDAANATPVINGTPVVHGTPASSLAIVEDNIKQKNVNFNGTNQAKNAPADATPKAARATDALAPTANATPVVHGTPATAAAIAEDAIQKRKADSNGRNAAKNVAPAANSAATAATDAPLRMLLL